MARMRWLGPTIVGVGALVAAAGIWYWLRVRPRAGDMIDKFDLPDDHFLVVSEEVNGTNSFLELRDHDVVVWQALIPHYAGTKGRPALAWSKTAVTVRVERGGRAEVFAVALQDSSKLGGFRLAPEHEPITTQPTGPITLTDHVRSYEIVGGQDWHQLVGVDLRTGNALWKTDLGRWAVTDGGVTANDIWLVQDKVTRHFNPFSGAEDRSQMH